jgi:hypothetical protein
MLHIGSYGVKAEIYVHMIWWEALPMIYQSLAHEFGSVFSFKPVASEMLTPPRKNFFVRAVEAYSFYVQKLQPSISTNL